MPQRHGNDGPEYAVPSYLLRESYLVIVSEGGS
jgi:hypothetical protein